MGIHGATVATMRRMAVAAALATLAGCTLFEVQKEPTPPPEPPKPTYAQPLATHTFPYDPQATGVVGTLQATIANEEDTLSDIARRFNLGYDEVVNANPASIRGCRRVARASCCRRSSSCRTPPTKASSSIWPHCGCSISRSRQRASRASS